jgi:hypothetical protein
MSAIDDCTGPPAAPTAPDPADCCGEGCANCILDLHEAAMERWRLALARWQARQSPPVRPDAAP